MSTEGRVDQTPSVALPHPPSRGTLMPEIQAWMEWASPHSQYLRTRPPPFPSSHPSENIHTRTQPPTQTPVTSSRQYEEGCGKVRHGVCCTHVLPDPGSWLLSHRTKALIGLAVLQQQQTWPQHGHDRCFGQDGDGGLAGLSPNS